MGKIVGLGYLGIEASDLEAWKTYATNIIGAQVVDDSADGFRLRLDDKNYRFEITKAERDGMTRFGWDVGSERSLDEICSAFDTSNIDYEHASADVARDKNVLGLIKVKDPGGNNLELFFGQRSGKPFMPSRVMVDSFTTGDDLGLGHVVLICSQLEASLEFYANLGFRTSERIFMDPPGVFAHFLHCNKRQHSLAMIPGPADFVHHFMVETNSMLDVGTAYDTALDMELPMVMTMGQHTNDMMTSFYTQTPGGFAMEYGTGGILIDDSDSWQVKEFDEISFWGHRSQPGATVAPSQ